MMNTKLKSITLAASMFMLGNVCMHAHAQDAATQTVDAINYSINPLKDRYPADSIQSQQTADAALKDVNDARTQVEARYTLEQRACYPKFFTTSCLDKATERRREDLNAIRPIEVEANAYLRKAKVVERDRKLADKAAENEAEAADRAKQGEHRAIVTQEKQQSNERGAISKEAQRQKRADETARKVADHEAKEQKRQADEAKNEEKRAANEAKYQKKVQESEQRQKQVVQKKADREKQRALKAARDANKASAPAEPPAE